MAADTCPGRHRTDRGVTTGPAHGVVTGPQRTAPGRRSRVGTCAVTPTTARGISVRVPAASHGGRGRGPGPAGDESPGPTVQLAHSFECIERGARLPWTVSSQHDRSATGAGWRYGVVVLPSPWVWADRGCADAGGPRPRGSAMPVREHGARVGARRPRGGAGRSSPSVRLRRQAPGSPPYPPGPRRSAGPGRGRPPAGGPPRRHSAARGRGPGGRVAARARAGRTHGVRVVAHSSRAAQLKAAPSADTPGHPAAAYASEEPVAPRALPAE